MQLDTQGNPDSRLMVQFRMGTVEDLSGPLKQGFKVFKDVPWVRIMVAGERDVYDQPAWIDESDHPAQNAHNIRFPIQWERFRKGHLEQTPGLPLSEWPQCLRSHVESLGHMKIRTVEQLASVSDGNLHNLGPGYLALRQKAQLFLKNREAEAPLERMREELSTRDSEIAVLKAQMAQVLAAKGMEIPAIATEDAPKKRGPGRPSKAETAANAEG